MFVQSVAAAPGLVANAVGSVIVDAPHGDAPLRTFRRTLYARLPTGPLAEALEIDEAATTLTGAFAAYSYDALSVSELSLRAVRSTWTGGTVIVELDAPRRVIAIRLSAVRVPTPGYALELYRMDGDTLASEPSFTVTAGSQPYAEFAVDFTDARFAVRLREPDGDLVAGLVAGHLLDVVVQSEPAHPRLRLALPSTVDDPPDPAGAVTFWPPPDDVAGAAGAEALDASASLARLLARSAARLVESLRDSTSPGETPELPTHLDLALVIESDAPCAFTASTFGIGYRLVRQSFVSRLEKERLRVGGAGQPSAPVAVRLPGGAQIVAATARASPSLRPERPDTTAEAGNGGGAAGGALSPADPPVGRRGVRLDPGHWVACRVERSDAVAVTGVLVALVALDADAGFEAALVEDAGGLPSGRILATGALARTPAGRPAWSALRFGAPIVISSAPHWLRVGATVGAGVWLGTPGDRAAVSVAREARGASGELRAAFSDRELMFTLLSGRGSGSGPGAGPEAVARVGAVDVASAPGSSGALEFDLVAALQAVVSAGAPGEAIDVPITLASAAPGLLTLYPPRVTFDAPAGS